MAGYRTHYQPAWIDFSMFWSAIVFGLSLAIILQLESTSLSWLAVAVAGVTILVAIVQILLLRLVATPKGLRLTSFFKSNTINLAWADIEDFTNGRLTVMLKTIRSRFVSDVRQKAKTKNRGVDQKTFGNIH